MHTDMVFSALAALIAVLAGLYSIIPSVLQPVIWRDVSPLRVFEGASAPNTLLQNTRRVEGDFTGPESLAVDPSTGNVYVGFSDGSIGAFASEGKYLERVLFVGALLDPHAPPSLFAWCNLEARSKRLAWNVEGERKCGRPLGLRVSRNEAGHSLLYFLDAYHGLFSYDLVKNSSVHLVSSSATIRSSEGAELSTLMPMKFFNDLDVLPDGDIVFSDSSYANSRSENRKEVLDGAGRGRLFRYSPLSAQLSLLLCGLHFPNGVQSIRKDNRSFILAGELARFRILRVDIDHPHIAQGRAAQRCGEEGDLHSALQVNDIKQTGIEVFADSVPGLIDNIRFHSLSDGRQLFYVGLGSKATHPFSLLHFAYRYIWPRELIGKLVPMKYVDKLVPKYGLVLAYDEEGKAAQSFHDPSGNAVSLVSQATIHPHTKEMWVGSHSEPFVSILPGEFVK